MEARTHERSTLIYNLKVENADTGDLIGYIVDLNVDGMMLISEHETTTPAVANLRIYLPKIVMAGDAVEVTGEMRWCRKRISGAYYTGVRLTEIPESARESVSELMDRFRQDEFADSENQDPYLHNLDPRDIRE